MNTNMVGGRRRSHVSKSIFNELFHWNVEKTTWKPISCLAPIWCQIFQPQVMGKSNTESIILQRFLWFGLADMLKISGNQLLDLIRYNRQKCQNVEPCDISNFF